MQRFVTGLRADGKSHVVDDRPPPWVLTDDAMPGMEIAYVWTTDAQPVAPNQGTDQTRLDQDFFPGATGSRFIVNTYPPGFGAKPERRSGEGEGGGLDHLYMHATTTIDYAVVLQGTMTLILDSGEEVTLRPLDTVVQNGTNHGWRNSTDEPVVMAFVILGAQSG